MKKILLFFAVTQGLIITACSTFIPDEDADKLKMYESVNGSYQEYILLEDVDRNDLVLEKGERVKIIIVTGDEWVKVYAYRANDDLLKSVRFLILQMFTDDFPDNKFNREKFDLELGKIVVKAGASVDKKSTEEKKKPVKKANKKGKSK
ncbi:MAG TPA: hypothetical protein PK514_02410 [Spirochaetota bacterium]|nr:hypothetical protein [Spirochaetota bacterium]